MSKKVIYKKDDVLNFGKYKGRTVRDVLSFHPSYLVWAHNTISWFKLEKSTFDKAVDYSVQQTFHRYVHRYIEDCPYWFEDDNGSWLS